MNVKTIKTGKEFRSAKFAREAINVDDRTVELAFSSEQPYERWFGIEILDHSSGSVDLTRLADGAHPLLLDHDTRKQIGVIETVSISSDRVGRARVRFGRSALAEEVFQDVIDGIRSLVSVGYQINELKMVEEKKDAPTVYRATSWTPYEVSIVSIPADASVGVGRSAEQRDVTTVINISVESSESETSETETETTDAAEETTQTTGTAQATATITESKAMPDIQVIEAARAEEAKQVRADINTIIGLGEMHAKRGGDKLAAEAIRSGKTAEAFRAELLDHLSKSTPETTTVNLTEKETKQYSYAGAIRSALDMVEGRKASGFEAEISEQMEKDLPSSYKRNGGILVPLQLRAPTAATLYNASTLGAEGVFTQQGEFIELLRNASVLVGAGARVMSGLTGPVSFPKQSGAATMYWMAENDSTDVTASALALTSVSLAAKTLQGTTGFSRQLLAQSSLDVEMLVREDLAAGHALAWDKAGIHGTGNANQPSGIYVAGSVNSVAMGGVPTFGKLTDMVSAVLSDNALNGALSFITTPGMAGKLAQTLKASAAGSDMIWVGKLNDGELAGYRAVASNQVSSILGGGAEHGIVFGNFNDMLIGMWGGLELVVDPYALKKQGLIEVTSFQLVDIALRHGESFAKATGATIA